MHDFNCSNADDMNFDLMAERTQYLKESTKGVSEMCKVIEDMRMESEARGKEIGRFDTLFDLVRRGLLTVEQAADSAGVPVIDFCERMSRSAQI